MNKNIFEARRIAQNIYKTYHYTDTGRVLRGNSTEFLEDTTMLAGRLLGKFNKLLERLGLSIPLAFFLGTVTPVLLFFAVMYYMLNIY